MDMVVTPRGGGVAVGLNEELSEDILGNEPVVGGESCPVVFGWSFLSEVPLLLAGVGK